jgi:tripartite-type tricarboxylate transporter receptor subunit TctC
MRILLFALGLILSLGNPLYAQEPYYQGKQIRVVVGFTSGGFYDRWARLLSRHMPKHIPGKPDMIVQNMPGAGSVVATNYVYNIASQRAGDFLCPSRQPVQDGLRYEKC